MALTCTKNLVLIVFVLPTESCWLTGSARAARGEERESELSSKEEGLDLAFTVKPSHPSSNPKI